MKFLNELSKMIVTIFNLNGKKNKHNKKIKCNDKFNDIYNYKYKLNTSKQRKYKINK